MGDTIELEYRTEQSRASLSSQSSQSTSYVDTRTHSYQNEMRDFTPKHEGTTLTNSKPKLGSVVILRSTSHWLQEMTLQAISFGKDEPLHH